eukprot:TRINITY_DN3158_c0_g4_i3.p1 TRINITY_DN3158_c0_g4~~TRINITY_DN3158_c0_g4_i3.p1  ORF type:complete len:451 (-),score=99.40 TRINITY_DN3158_c0_g4_i3:132-1484(-)
MCIRDRYTNDDGEEVLCTFGLCQAHCRMSLKDNVVAAVYGMKRRVMTNGLSWLITIGIVFAVNTIYTPFLKTALMILACHPQYQCEFEHCWTFITQEFALAAFLSASVVLVLGLGFPALLLVQLLRRRAALNTAFFGEEYGDTYTSPDTRGPDFKPDSWFWGRKELSVSEWARFSASDNSALAQEYGDSSYRWLMMPALVLLFKVAVLIPAVFLEPRSFALRLGCGLVEILVAVFYFSTSTQLSPILLMTIRAASVHQLLFLGFQNIDLVTEFDSGLSLSMLLIAITLTYVAFSVIVFIATVVYPIFLTQTDKKQAKRFLNSHSLDFSTGISLYLEPQGHEELEPNELEDCEEEEVFAQFPQLVNEPSISNAPLQKQPTHSIFQARQRRTSLDLLGESMARNEKAAAESNSLEVNQNNKTNADGAVIIDDLAEISPRRSSVVLPPKRKSL